VKYPSCNIDISQTPRPDAKNRAAADPILMGQALRGPLENGIFMVISLSSGVRQLGRSSRSPGDLNKWSRA